MAAATTGMDDPAQAATIVRFMLGVPLDSDPGSKSVYSNFGFNVLGRIIEHVSGQPYAEYVRDRVLTPAGVTDMRIGRTRLENRAPGEVHYYAPPGMGRGESVYWGEGYVPDAYGSFYMEAMDSHGGWIGSAADLVRFATAVDGQRGEALLTPAALRAMIDTPRPAESGIGSGWDMKPVTYGLGWDMTPVAGGVDWAKPVALGGSTAAWIYRGVDGLAIAFVFNSLPDDFRQIARCGSGDPGGGARGPDMAHKRLLRGGVSGGHPWRVGFVPPWRCLGDYLRAFFFGIGSSSAVRAMTPCSQAASCSRSSETTW
jgi:N-acyl-D-amino-acid deacylase